MVCKPTCATIRRSYCAVLGRSANDGECVQNGRSPICDWVCNVCRLFCDLLLLSAHVCSQTATSCSPCTIGPAASCCKRVETCLQLVAIRRCRDCVEETRAQTRSHTLLRCTANVCSTFACVRRSCKFEDANWCSPYCACLRMVLRTAQYDAA